MNTSWGMKLNDRVIFATIQVYVEQRFCCHGELHLQMTGKTLKKSEEDPDPCIQQIKWKGRHYMLTDFESRCSMRSWSMRNSTSASTSVGGFKGFPESWLCRNQPPAMAKGHCAEPSPPFWVTDHFIKITQLILYTPSV